MHEQNYGITELETLGLVWAVKIFRTYILGHHCVVLTDHAACTSLLGSTNPSSKLARWAMAIQELDLDIRHCSGKTNRVADALSRNPVPASSTFHVTDIQNQPVVRATLGSYRGVTVSSPLSLSALKRTSYLLLKLVGTVKINTSGYHPQCDVLVEKINGTLTNMLSKSATKHGCDWDAHLPYLLFAYRVAVQESTQASPFYLLYGREARIPTESALTQPRTPYQVEFSDYCSELVANLSDAWALAHQNIAKAQKKQKRQYDKRATPMKLKVGDRVMVHFPNQVKGKAWKLARPYFGPYKVLSLTPTNAEVQLMDAAKDSSIFVSLDRVRLCYEEMTDDVWAGPDHCTPKKSRRAAQLQKQASGTTTRALGNKASTKDSVGPVTRSMTRKSQT